MRSALQGLDVEVLERLGVVEVLAQRVAARRVLVEHRQVELVRPPVLVRPGPAAPSARGVDGWVLALAAGVRHVGGSPLCCGLVRAAGSLDGRLGRYALGASAPVDDLGLVDLVARVVGGREARRVADRAVDVDHLAAGAADQVVVVVAHAVLVAGRASRRAGCAGEALVGEGAEDVVDGLAGHGADLGPHRLVDVVGRAVGPVGHRPQHGQPLGRHVQPVPTEQRLGGLGHHSRTVGQILEQVQKCAERVATPSVEGGPTSRRGQPPVSQPTLGSGPYGRSRRPGRDQMVVAMSGLVTFLAWALSRRRLDRAGLLARPGRRPEGPQLLRLLHLEPDLLAPCPDPGLCRGGPRPPGDAGRARPDLRIGPDQPPLGASSWTPSGRPDRTSWTSR